MADTPVLRGKRGVDGTLSIATVSWAVDPVTGGSVTSSTFRKALSDRRARLPEAVDFILASGCAVNDAVVPEDFLAASDDVPILFEQNREDRCSWMLLYRSDGIARSTTLRSEQLVKTFGQKPEQKQKQKQEMSSLATVIAGGGGFFRFEGFGPAFLLLICGENNVLDWTRRRSVLRPTSSVDEHGRIAGNLQEWILVNPAHRPYWPQIRSTGFCKVGKDRRGAGPTLHRLVEQDESYQDGTRAPVAVIHCNNFYATEERTKEYASLGFRGPHCCVASSDPVIPENDAQWLWACHTLTPVRARAATKEPAAEKAAAATEKKEKK